jgi:metal-dependent amidase/aminoacylase/carboxypeptidase family protein
MPILNRIAECRPAMAAWRQDPHEHAEPGFAADLAFLRPPGG